MGNYQRSFADEQEGCFLHFTGLTTESDSTSSILLLLISSMADTLKTPL